MFPQSTGGPLQSPELTLTLTGVLPTSVGIRFAGIHVRLEVTVVLPQVTVGAGIGVFTSTSAAVILQARVGLETVMSPQLALNPAQTPLFVLTLTVKGPVFVGVRFVGVHARLVLTVSPLQVTMGVGEIAMPFVPVVASISQIRVGLETYMSPQVAVNPMQRPDFALTLTVKGPVLAGVRFAGVHVRSVLLTVAPWQVTVGVGIALPFIPVSTPFISQINCGLETVMFPQVAVMPWQTPEEFTVTLTGMLFPVVVGI